MRILCLGAALVSERIIPDEASALPVSKILEVGIAVCELAVLVDFCEWALLVDY